MGMLDNVRDMMKMRSEQKKIQAEIMRISVAHSNGGITVEVKGDGSVNRIAIDPSAYDEVKAGKPARFETMLLNVVNAAIKKAKDEAQAHMMKYMRESGLASGLFGK